MDAFLVLNAQTEQRWQLLSKLISSGNGADQARGLDILLKCVQAAQEKAQYELDHWEELYPDYDPAAEAGYQPGDWVKGIDPKVLQLLEKVGFTFVPDEEYDAGQQQRPKAEDDRKQPASSVPTQALPPPAPAKQPVPHPPPQGDHAGAAIVPPPHAPSQVAPMPPPPRVVPPPEIQLPRQEVRQPPPPPVVQPQPPVGVHHIPPATVKPVQMPPSVAMPQQGAPSPVPHIIQPPHQTPTTLPPAVPTIQPSIIMPPAPPATKPDMYTQVAPAIRMPPPTQPSTLPPPPRAEPPPLPTPAVTPAMAGGSMASSFTASGLPPAVLPRAVVAPPQPLPPPPRAHTVATTNLPAAPQPPSGPPPQQSLPTATPPSTAHVPTNTPGAAATLGAAVVMGQPPRPQQPVAVQPPAPVPPKPVTLSPTITPPVVPTPPIPTTTPIVVPPPPAAPAPAPAPIPVPPAPVPPAPLSSLSTSPSSSAPAPKVSSPTKSQKPPTPAAPRVPQQKQQATTPPTRPPSTRISNRAAAQQQAQQPDQEPDPAETTAVAEATKEPPATTAEGGEAPAAPVELPATEAEIEEILKKREKAIMDYRAKDLSMSLLMPPMVPSRVKTHWDYLLGEMQSVAVDFHEERKWKHGCRQAVGGQAAAVARRRGARVAVQGGNKLRDVGHMMCSRVKAFWNTSISDVSWYTSTEGGLQLLPEEGEEAALDVNPLDAALMERARTSETTLREVAAQHGVEAIAPYLLPHQTVALRWLVNITGGSCGGILADQAGMGTTATAVAYLKAVLGQGPSGLVIVPYWSASHWLHQLRLQGLVVLPFETWLSRKDAGPGQGDVVLCTTTHLTSRDGGELMGKSWGALVVDGRDAGTKHDDHNHQVPHPHKGVVAPDMAEWAYVTSLVAKTTNLPRRVLLLDQRVTRSPERLAAWMYIVAPGVFSSPDQVIRWAERKAAIATANNLTLPQPAGEAARTPRPLTVQDTLEAAIRSFSLARSFASCQHLADVAKVTVIKCPMPRLQAEEYKRLHSATLPKDPTECASRILALRYACSHASLSFWYQPRMFPVSLPPLVASLSQNPSNLSQPQNAASNERVFTFDEAVAQPSIPSINDDWRLSSRHNTKFSIEGSGKLPILLKILREQPEGHKTLILAGAALVLSALHTWLTAWGVRHDCAFPTDMHGNTSMSEYWHIGQAVVERFNTTPASVCKTLIAQPAWISSRVGRLPIAADTVIVFEDYWSRDGRSHLRDVLCSLRVRQKPIRVLRLVMEGTIESALWPTTEEHTKDLERVMGGASITSVIYGEAAAAATAGSPPPAQLETVETAVATVELALSESLLPRDLGRAADQGHSRIMAKGGKFVGLYAQRFLWYCSNSTEGGQVDDEKCKTLPGITSGDLEMDEEQLLLQEAQYELVFEVGSHITDAQALRQIVNDLLAKGIEVDPYIAGPPMGPPEGQVEYIHRESWLADTMDDDIGMELKFVEVVDLQKMMGKVTQAVSGGRVMTLPPSGLRSDGDGLGRPPRPVKPAVAHAEWTHDEDAELLRAYDLYGRHPVVVPFAINRRTSQYGRKRSARQCFDRLDWLLREVGEGRLKINKPSPPPVRQLQRQLYPDYPGLKVGKPEEAESPETVNKISARCAMILHLHHKGRRAVPRDDGPVDPNRVTVENMETSPVSTPLEIVNKAALQRAVSSSTVSPSGSSAPPTPSIQGLGAASFGGVSALSGMTADIPIFVDPGQWINPNLAQPGVTPVPAASSSNALLFNGLSLPRVAGKPRKALTTTNTANTQPLTPGSNSSASTAAPTPATATSAALQKKRKSGGGAPANKAPATATATKTAANATAAVPGKTATPTTTNTPPPRPPKRKSSAGDGEV